MTLNRANDISDARLTICQNFFKPYPNDFQAYFAIGTRNLVLVVMEKVILPIRASCFSILNEMKMILVTDVACKEMSSEKVSFLEEVDRSPY